MGTSWALCRHLSIERPARPAQCLRVHCSAPSHGWKDSCGEDAEAGLAALSWTDQGGAVLSRLRRSDFQAHLRERGKQKMALFAAGF